MFPGLRVLAAALALLAVIGFGQMARALEPRSVDPEKMIKACWKISKKDRDSGVTGRMRHGAARTVGCLEEVIIGQVKIMFEPDVLSAAQAQKYLDQLRNGAGKLYWDIYNNHKGCFCGTMYQLLHLSGIADILERMIRVMARQRNEFRVGLRGRGRGAKRRTLPESYPKIEFK